MSSAHQAPLSWVWKNSLRILFPFTLPWVPLFLSADHLYAIASEGSWLHNSIEIFMLPGALLVSTLFSIILYRLWPDFLRVDARVPIWFVIKKICLNTLLMFILLTIATVIICLFIEPPPWKSENPQYYPIIFFAVVFFPPLLTPMFALIAIWRSIVEKTLQGQKV